MWSPKYARLAFRLAVFALVLSLGLTKHQLPTVYMHSLTEWSASTGADDSGTDHLSVCQGKHCVGAYAIPPKFAVETAFGAGNANVCGHVWWTNIHRRPLPKPPRIA